VSGFLLDTNVTSEQIRSKPNPAVTSWLFTQPEHALFMSAVTIGELRKGFVLLPAGSQRSRLQEWFHTVLIPRFRERILSVTCSVADRWGTLDGERRLRGAPLNTADAMIAATALEHGLTLVTRNVKDFAGLQVGLFNPWAHAP
jgi:predicted nucleic acid-binding protein